VSEWFEWKGGECPVPWDTRVQLRTALGESRVTFVAKGVVWDNTEREVKLIAYRIVEDQS
jgi:hypothetical protein